MSLPRPRSSEYQERSSQVVDGKLLGWVEHEKFILFPVKFQGFENGKNKKFLIENSDTNNITFSL
jgi:hypothetical protein